MIVRFTPPLPCDIERPDRALCGAPTWHGIVRVDGHGWRLIPICPVCARRLACGSRPSEVRHAA